MITMESELTAPELGEVLKQIRQQAALKRILEVGSAAGGTLCEMIRVVDHEFEPNRVEVCVVDTFEYFKDHEVIWRENLTRCGIDPDRVRLWKGKSNEVRAGKQKELPCPYFSFILIDAGHKLKDVVRDTRWLEFLEVGGVAAFHDYSERFPGVCRAVDIFLARNPGFKMESRQGTLIVIRKTRAGASILMPWWLVGWLTVESVTEQWKRSVLKRLPGRGA